MHIYFSVRDVSLRYVVVVFFFLRDTEGKQIIPAHIYAIGIRYLLRDRCTTLLRNIVRCEKKFVRAIRRDYKFSGARLTHFTGAFFLFLSLLSLTLSLLLVKRKISNLLMGTG